MLEKIIEAIMENFKERINEIASHLYDYLLNGNLAQFEEELYKEVIDLYNKIAFAFIAHAAQSKEMEEKARILGQKKGLRAIRKETVRLQLKTGEIIRIFSWYAAKANPKKRKQKKRGPNGSGCHLILEYWGCILKASPSYYSFVTMLSILCPSFEIVLRVLKYQQIQGEYKRIRKLAYQVAQQCFANRIRIGLKPGENLAGKRVIISIDGGRTRTRKNNPSKKPSKGNKGKREKFDTPWREPKLFVIHVIDNDGNISKVDLPIYDALIGHADQCFDLLFDYLKQLQIDKASQVLFIADGATWIWDRAKLMLLSLGVAEEKITEAVDYYHAVEHITRILYNFSKKQLSPKQKKALFKELKSDLYNGRIDQIIEKISKIANGRKRILKELDYFKKNEHRMQYHSLRTRKFPCGSGIVESAIRRIINLRFKSPSTFWEVKNAEKLIFLRAVFMANRWDIMIKNLSYKNHRHNSLSMAA